MLPLHVLENEQISDSRIYQTLRPVQDNANLYAPLPLTGNPIRRQNAAETVKSCTQELNARA